MSLLITEIIPTILNLFKTGSKFRKSHNEERDVALKAIYEACVDTKLYIRNWEKTGKRNRKREQDLAWLWKKISIPVRHFDSQLADKCYYKGEYWLDPENWSEDDTNRLRIELERVIAEARNLKVMSDDEYEKNRLRPVNNKRMASPSMGSQHSP